MERIQKEHVIAGLVGGAVTLSLEIILMKTVPGLFGAKKEEPKSMKAEIHTMSSSRIPTAIGPYNAGKRVQCCGADLAFSSGQIGVDRKTGELVSDNIEEQVDQALKNIKSLAEDNNLSLKNIVKNNLFIVDMADFPKVNEVYKKYFEDEYPARTCVACKQLPKGAKFEIEAIFFKP